MAEGIGMRNLLMEKKSKVVNETEGPNIEMASMISRVSGQSVGEIDHLIAGLQGVRRKLVDEGDRLEREVGEYVAFSQSVSELTKIVSEAMTFIKVRKETVGGEDAASLSVNPAN
jgi:hypothetical protein